MFTRIMLCFRVISVVSLSITPGLNAAEVGVDLDTAKTRIDFVLTDVLHTVRGTFRLKQGHFTFDPSAGAITGDVIIDAASGNSGSAARDKRMTRDILEAQRYPEIRFAPHKFTGMVSTTGYVER